MSRRQALRALAGSALSAGFVGWLGSGWLRRAHLRWVRETRLQLGTIVSITTVHQDADAARAASDAAFAEIERLEAILSRHRADSPLSRLNRDGILRHSPPELLEVLRFCLDLARETGGAFDPTILPVLDCYTRSFNRGGVPPEAHELRQALELVGWSGVRVEGDVVAFQRPGMGITLDGAAKGYIVDRAVAALAAAGAGPVLVEAGGDVGVSGERGPGEPWRVAILDAPTSGRRPADILLSGGGLATSGDEVEAFDPDRKHHHILDPRTGLAALGCSSVTVAAPTALEADALATAAFVLGPGDGLALLERRHGVEGRIVPRGVTGERTTSGFGALLEGGRAG